jgi:hypothetical protein
LDRTQPPDWHTAHWQERVGVGELLFLHENYEQTLPIYNSGSGASSGDSSSAGDELVICLLLSVKG